MEIEVEKKAVIYTRVSSQEQVDNFSLGSQKEACEKLAKAQGFTISKYFTDEGISAKSSENRPGLQEMLSYCTKNKNKISAVFVYNFSRLNRNTRDFLEVKLLLAKYGVMLISTSEPSGTDSPTERAIQTILSAVNQLDNENKAITVSANMKKRFLDGYPLTRPRIGYMSAEINGKKEHVPDPEWFDIIKTMWLKIANEKITLGQAKAELNKLGKRKFSTQYTSKIFASKFYAGYNVSSKYGEVLGKHAPMITLDTFYEARVTITGRKQAQVDKQYLRDDFPLKGILVCSECSRKLTAAWSKGKLKRYGYYSCSSRGVHKSISVRADDLELQFMALLEALKPSKELSEVVKQLMIEKYNSSWNMINQSTNSVNDDLKKLDLKKQFILDKHAAGIYTDEEYLKLKEQIEIDYTVKKGIISENKLTHIDIETVMEFHKNLISNIDKIFVNTSLRGKLALGCSIFPKGVEVENGILRTPEIARIYNLNSTFETHVNQSTPYIYEFEHLIQDYLNSYQTLRQYV
jgi:DNA invertase Pin-like site-specific DNA recombinase